MCHNRKSLERIRRAARTADDTNTATHIIWTTTIRHQQSVIDSGQTVSEHVLQIRTDKTNVRRHNRLHKSTTSYRLPLARWRPILCSDDSIFARLIHDALRNQCESRRWMEHHSSCQHQWSSDFNAQTIQCLARHEWRSHDILKSVRIVSVPLSMSVPIHVMFSPCQNI